MRKIHTNRPRPARRPPALRSGAAFFASTLLLFCAVIAVSLWSYKPTKAHSANPKSVLPTPTFRFPAYFVEWGVYERDYVPADIPTDLITHVNYAFIKPDDVDRDGYYECAINDPWAAMQMPIHRVVPGTDNGRGENLGTLNQFQVLKRNNPNLQVLMAVGGWTLSYYFHTIASTPAHRQHFAQACAAFMETRGFDGIDIDWEFPSAADRNNYTALLQAIRQELDIVGSRNGRTYPLTIAAPAGIDNIVNIDIAGITPSMSWINLMSYDFNGGWDSVTGHNSPLCASSGDPHGIFSNCNAAVLQYLVGGIPASKINLGLPYYGRGFHHLQNAGPNPTYPGRFAPVTPSDYVTGTWDIDGVFAYWDIMERFTGPYQEAYEPLPVLNNYTRYWDPEQNVPFLFRPDAIGPNGQGVWMGYDDPQSLALKVQYARTQGLGGVSIWELSEESHPGMAQHPLSSAIATAIAEPLIPFYCGQPTPTPDATGTATTRTVTSTATRTLTQVPSGTGTPVGTGTPGTGTGTPGTGTGTPAITGTPRTPGTGTPGTPISTGTPGTPGTGTGTPATTGTPGTRTTTPAATPTFCPVLFTDVQSTDYFYAAVRYLFCSGAISGYADGTFRPYNNTTRGQLTKIVSLSRGWPILCPETGRFSDVPVGSTFYCYIETAYAQGVINGYADGTFHPYNNVTRGQLSKIIVLAMGWPVDCPPSGHFSDVPLQHAFYCHVETAYTRGVVSGYADGTFQPGNNATRGQICAMVYRALSNPSDED